MVILQIQVTYFVVLDRESQPPVGCDVKAPCAFATAGKLMNFPNRERPEFAFGFHAFKKEKHFSELIHGSRWNALGLIVVAETLQTLV